MKCYYYYTLPAFALNAYDAREAAEAACTTWISSLRGLDVLCGRADRLVTASGSELCQRPPVAVSGSRWAAPVLCATSQPLWAMLVYIGRSH